MCAFLCNALTVLAKNSVAICGKGDRGWIGFLCPWLRSHISGCGLRQPLFDVLR